MADDTPQDTTQTQDTPATGQSAVQEPTQEIPKPEEQQKETPPTETLTEESKVEPVPETPQTPEPPKEEVKQEEQKTTEETKPVEENPKPEEKTKEEVKPEPEKPQPPQINLDELRTKANKERQDRKQEHLSEVEKLAKSKQINNDDVRELLHVSQSTATNYLEELTKQGKLKKSGNAKATTYSS